MQEIANTMCIVKVQFGIRGVNCDHKHMQLSVEVFWLEIYYVVKVYSLLDKL